MMLHGADFTGIIYVYDDGIMNCSVCNGIRGLGSRLLY
jgi:hypothetical protein